MRYFAEVMAGICNRSALAGGRKLRWLIIANPTAGGFAMRSRWKKHLCAMEESKAAAGLNPLHGETAPAAIAAKPDNDPFFASCGLIPTEGPGHAKQIAAALAAEIESIPADEKQMPFYLVITAGGDGTSLEVLSVLYHASEKVRANLAVIRLPMGTGNDGSDSPNLAGALNLIIKPSRVEFTPALRLVTSPDGPACGNSPYLAFNILSVGIDAFITHMTNKMKGKLPGDFYKLWVDIASLLYDLIYKVGYLDVKVPAINGGETMSFREKLLLLAVGISGHRTYGSQKKILPDDRNACAIKQMPLLRKLALKEQFLKGEHINRPEAIMFNANRVEISGEYPILAQMDGEAVLLKKEDFPVAIELTEPVIPVLRLVNGPSKT